jgi:hypothetical protein
VILPPSLGISANGRLCPGSPVDPVEAGASCDHPSGTLDASAERILCGRTRQHFDAPPPGSSEKSTEEEKQ